MPTAQAQAELTYAAYSAYSAYVRSPAMPCPYSRLHTTFLELRGAVDGPRTREQLRLALEEFWPDESKSVLAIVPRETPRNHEAARAQACWLRYHCHYLHLEYNGELDDAETVDGRLRRHYRHWIADAAGFLDSRIQVGPADLMVTAFNHLYDAEHPRYAPHVVIPVIRSRDLQDIHKRQPAASYRIAAQAKAKLVLSMLSSRAGIEISDIEREYPRWLVALTYYRDFITEVYTDSYRIDPRIPSRIPGNRQHVTNCLESEQFQASLFAFRAMIKNSLELPLLARILTGNPAVSVFDIAKIIYGETAGLYIMPPTP